MAAVGLLMLPPPSSESIPPLTTVLPVAATVPETVSVPGPLSVRVNGAAFPAIEAAPAPPITNG